MRTSVERLRIGLLLGAGLLVLVIAAFLGYARYRVHRALVELPGKLGATITKEFNGWTYSQSDGKKTVFTIHASKAVQHKDGMLTLHDVSMVLYGKKGDRADRISGDDFEYDTRDEVIRALGIVHLDLEAPVAAGSQTSEAAKHLGPATSEPEDAQPGSRIIHVKTSGLVYMKKLGVAATAQAIEFAFGGFTGHAVGAEYDSDTGHLVLQSALTMSGLDKDRPIAMMASHGELDRERNQAEFIDAHYSSAGQTAQAPLARLHLRADGSVERVEGDQHVTLQGAEQGSVTSDRADVMLDAKSKPKTAALTGNVHFAQDTSLRQASGDSERANVSFDGMGRVEHAVLQGHVRTLEIVRQPGISLPAPSQRNLTADSLELSLVTQGKEARPQLRDATALGNARLSSVAPDAKHIGLNTTKLAGDSLTAHLVTRDGVAQLSTVHGVGHTAVEQISANTPEKSPDQKQSTAQNNTDQKTSGDTFDAVFRPGAKGKGQVELASAVEQGSVMIDRFIPGRRKSPAEASPAVDVQHATAARAAFDADTNKLTLTGAGRIGDGRTGDGRTGDGRTGDPRAGNVRMRDAQSEVSAAQVVLEQDSGDATADGAVKVSYLQPGQAEPVHVLAARAEFNHDASQATFYGRAAGKSSVGSSGLARMWQPGTGGQSGSQVEAPVLIFDQELQRLTARAEAITTLGSVQAVLLSNPPARDSTISSKTTKKPDKAAVNPETNGMKSHGQGVARITSSLMVYSDLERKAEFSGGVKVLDGDGEMRAQQATVFLTVAHPAKRSQPVTALADSSASTPSTGTSATTSGSSIAGLLGGNVERIVATQHIELTQPGREATGERLVYTASDQMFMLTGTPAAPPKLVDQVQGTTTGAMLRFHYDKDSDSSVVVSGSYGTAPIHRVRTETTVQTEQTAPPSKARHPAKVASRPPGSTAPGIEEQGMKVKQ